MRLTLLATFLFAAPLFAQPRPKEELVDRVKNSIEREGVIVFKYQIDEQR